MSYRCGIIGLSNADKTTIFHALTSGTDIVASTFFCTINPQRAELGLTATGSARLLWESSRLLGPVTFSTIVGPEVRAWHVPAGTSPGRRPGPCRPGKRLHSG